MILNPDKFQAILLHKRKGHHTIHRIVVDNQNLKVVSSVEVPAISWLSRKENYRKQLFYGKFLLLFFSLDDWNPSKEGCKVSLERL